MDVQPSVPEARAASPQSVASSNNKIWIGVGCVVLACCCLMVLAIAIAGPALLNVYSRSSSGGNNGNAPSYTGNADELLRTDTLNAIKVYEAGKSGCKDISLLAGQMLTAPNASGIWTESWQVRACDTTDAFTVTFTPSPNGGTDYSVKPENP